MAEGWTGDGDYAARAVLQQKAVALRHKGYSWQRIADTLELGDPPRRQRAYELVQSAWKNNKVEIARDLDMYREELDERDDNLREKLLAMLEQFPYTVSDGQIVKDDDGNPLYNAETHLKVMDRLMKLDDRFALRHGLDMDKGLAAMLARRADLESDAMVQAILAGVAAVPGITPEQRRIMLEAAAAELQRSQEPEVIPGEIVRRDDQ